MEDDNHSKDEGDQGHSRRTYSINGASNYSTGGRLLIRPKFSPLALEILNHPVLRIKMSSCKYDGSSDPDNHVAAYEGHMYVYT